LVAAKLLAKGETDRARFPALRRTGVIAADGSQAMEQYAEEAAERQGVVGRVTGT
jgi:hypothetical protein